MITEHKIHSVHCDTIGCPTPEVQEPGEMTLTYVINSLNHMGWYIGLDGSPVYCPGCYAAMQASGRMPAR